MKLARDRSEGRSATAADKFTAKREAIIAAGSKLINRQGLKRTTLASVAASVGLITTSVTYYFKRKEDLAAACIINGIERLEALATTALREATAEARITRFIELYFDLYARIRLEREPPVCLVNDIRALGKDVAAPALSAHRKLFERLRALHGEGHAPTPAEKLAIDSRTFLLLVLIYWIPLWSTRYDTEDFPRIAARMTDILLKGLASRKSARWPALKPLRFHTPAERDQKEMFLVAATEMINRHGYHGASIDKIAARLEVTKGSFYHHLESKDDLVALCFERTFGMISAAQRAAIALPENGFHQLAAACVALVELQFSEDGPLLTFNAFSALPEQAFIETVQRSDRIPIRFAEMISGGIADGSIRALDPFIAGQMVTAMIDSAGELPVAVRGITAKDAIAQFVQPLLFGLLR